jgi:hypothetical protein
MISYLVALILKFSCLQAAPELLVAPEDPPVIHEFTHEERRELCAKYEGGLIAFYGEVYRVEKCKRRSFAQNKSVYEQQRRGEVITVVDQRVIAALAEGEPIDEAKSVETARSCNELERHYVTYSNVDVYFVENCKKRLFPDWETYLAHRKKRGEARAEILNLSWIEFSRLSDGPPILSVLNEEFRDSVASDSEVDIMPVDEACKGVEGKVVSYYSYLYRIERCRKRVYLDPNVVLKPSKQKKEKFIPLTSEQWLSLPDGEPIDVTP